MKAFITGSHAYGKPHPESDVDLVLRVDEKTRANLVRLLAETGEVGDQYEAGVLQFKTGKLNLILCVTDAQYGAWKTGTDGLCALAPVTREQAVTLFKSLFEIVKAKSEVIETTGTPVTRLLTAGSP